MTLLTLAASVALKFLTGVAAVDGRPQKSCRIVEESFSGPRLELATARRLSNQLLFAWRKAYRKSRNSARTAPGPSLERGQNHELRCVMGAVFYDCLPLRLAALRPVRGEVATNARSGICGKLATWSQCV